MNNSYKNHLITGGAIGSGGFLAKLIGVDEKVLLDLAHQQYVASKEKRRRK
jgi:hypothetical protein